MANSIAAFAVAHVPYVGGSSEGINARTYRSNRVQNSEKGVGARAGMLAICMYLIIVFAKCAESRFAPAACILSDPWESFVVNRNGAT